MFSAKGERSSIENEPYDSNYLFKFVGVIIYTRYMYLSECLTYFYN